mmetsp:Transcript_25342/g.51791  ORF Transcript_25342/g.51791 Transcript_25342/m.51791 type:complete len:305 (+) Transcript_25342:435-1349(+)
MKPQSRLHCFRTLLLSLFSTFFLALFLFFLAIIIVVVITPCPASFQLQSIQVWLEFIPLNEIKFLILPHHTDRAILLGQLAVSPHTSSQRPEGVHDKFVFGATCGLLIHLFQVRPPTLRPRTDRAGVVLVNVPARTALIQVWSGFVIRSDEEAHSIRPSNVRLRGPLVLVSEVSHHAPDRHGRAVDVLVVEALVPHPLRKGPGVGRQSRDADSHVIVDFKELLLVGGELRDGSFECTKDAVGRGADSDARRSLLHRFHGVLHLQEPSLRTPYSHIGVVLVAKHCYCRDPLGTEIVGLCGASRRC